MKIFEITTTLAMKDPDSLLAAFADKNAPLKHRSDGVFRMDRDWYAYYE